jgi:hypothetical protein
MEEEVGRERTGDRSWLSFLRSQLTGWSWRDEIDGSGAMMAEREAELAIVLRRCRHPIVVRRR